MKEGKVISAYACVIHFVYLNLNTLVRGMKDGPIGMYSDYLIWDAVIRLTTKRTWVRMSHVIITHVPPA
jgi:hypothetical protein